MYYLLYHQLSWSYDAVAWLVSLGNWSRWIDAGLPFLHKPNVLEIGFGPGHLLGKMAISGLHCMGIDASQQMCTIALKNISSINGYAQNPTILRGSSFSLPFPDQLFNSVISTFPSNYIFSGDTFREVSRVLVPGGNFIIVLSAAIIGKHVWERITAWLFGSSPGNDHWQETLLMPLASPFFTLSSHSIVISNSQVLVIEAIKVVA
jgi:ubiquinone/menaquinone biosynthesis C-methylase UbiE